MKLNDAIRIAKIVRQPKEKRAKLSMEENFSINEAHSVIVDHYLKRIPLKPGDDVLSCGIVIKVKGDCFLSVRKMNCRPFVVFDLADESFFTTFEEANSYFDSIPNNNL